MKYCQYISVLHNLLSTVRLWDRYVALFTWNSKICYLFLHIQMQFDYPRMDIDFYNSIQTKFMDSVKSNSNQIPGDAFHTDQSEFKCFIVTLYNYEDRSAFHIRS